VARGVAKRVKIKRRNDMAAETIISERTAAVTVHVLHAITSDMVPATIYATNLAGSEEVDIFIVTNINGMDTFETIIQETTTVVLSATDNTKTINSPMRIAVLKDASSGTAGVFLASRNRI